MADIEITASIRGGKSRKGELAKLRESRTIPGVVYGGGKKGNLLVTVSELALLKAMKTGGANTVIHLKHDEGEETVIVKDLQRHVVTNAVLHADFQRVDLAKKIIVEVPISVLGEPPGVKLHGGVLEHTLREVEVEALPGSIPQKIEVDISKLEIGEAIKAKDLIVPAGVIVLEDAEQIIVHVMHMKVEAEPVPGVDGEEVAEPEVLKQGKKEEGAEGEAADKKDGEKKDGGKKDGGKK
ncbi:MAG: 50S ribosomal protein L25 [Elusimicrobiota bacterium]